MTEGRSRGHEADLEAISGPVWEVDIWVITGHIWVNSEVNYGQF